MEYFEGPGAIIADACLDNDNDSLFLGGIGGGTFFTEALGERGVTVGGDDDCRGRNEGGSKLGARVAGISSPEVLCLTR